MQLKDNGINFGIIPKDLIMNIVNRQLIDSHFTIRSKKLTALTVNAINDNANSIIKIFGDLNKFCFCFEHCCILYIDNAFTINSINGLILTNFTLKYCIFEHI